MTEHLTEQKLTFDQFKEFNESGSLNKIGLEAHGTHYIIVGELFHSQKVIVVKRKGKEPRTYSDPERAMLQLKKIGITHIYVDMKLLKVE